MSYHLYKYAPNPLFPAYGIGPVEANEKLMQHYLSLNAWKIHFFAGMVAPSAVLEQSALIKDILFTPEDLERMTNKFNSYAAGKLGAGKAVMAPPGFNVKPWGSVPDLKGFNEEYMITTKEIYRVLGIPQYLSQLDEKDVPKFDNVYVQREDWQTNTIAPIIKTFSVLFNKILLAIGRADDLFFSYEDRITYDPARIRADMQAGILSPWQAMQYGGYDTSIISPAEEPSLKTHFMPSTMVPIEDLVYGWSTAGIATTPGSNAHTPASPAAPAVPSTPATPAPDTPAPSPNEKKSLHAGCTCHADKPVKVKYQQRLKSWRDNNSGGWRSRPAREVWRKGEARNQARNIAEDMLRLMRASLRKRYPITQKTYKDFLDGQNKRIKAGLEEEGYQKLLAHYEPLKSLGAGVNISKAGHDAFNAAVRAYVINTLDEDKENSLLVATTKEAYESITNSCIKNTESCLTISIEPEDVAGIISKVQLVGADRAPKVNETTLARMEREIRNSVRDGETYQEMSANLEDKFSQLSQYRSEMIARTELSKAYEKASIGAMESSGVVKTYEVYGCNPECSGWDCNRTDIEPHEVDDLDFHPNHTGAVVPQEYQADFGED